ncbi:MAG TPA: hypothetical protein VFV92_13685 [Candidatus Bathyarchaeia archaeon]|nr:hypothetical protein [Candidatus Bathyarchaeia archaeon]
MGCSFSRQNRYGVLLASRQAGRFRQVGPAAYFRWLKEELSPAYHTTSQTDSTLSLGKEMEGDSHIVTVTSHQGVGGALVEVRLVAMPD